MSDPSPEEHRSSQFHFQFDFVTQWYAIIPDQRNLRLEGARLLQRIAMHGDQAKAVLLVKSQRVKIIVRRGKPGTIGGFRR